MRLRDFDFTHFVLTLWGFLCLGMYVGKGVCVPVWSWVRGVCVVWQGGVGLKILLGASADMEHEGFGDAEAKLLDSMKARGWCCVGESV